MEWQESKFGADMHEWKLNEPVEGKLTEIKEDVGENKSRIYTIDKVRFWGTKVIDAKVDQMGIVVGEEVRITLLNEDEKFPNGRRGKNFKVEVKR